MTRHTMEPASALTVRGPVPAASLGVTLPHEHLLITMHHCMHAPQDAEARALYEGPLSLSTIGDLVYGAQVNRGDCVLADIDTAVEEASRFRDAGGGTIVDVTSIGIGRDPRGLVRIAEATGLNVIMGSSYYVEQVYPDREAMRRRGEADITAEIVRDVTEGVADTGVRAGIIGEVGCSTPLTDLERKVLRASAAAQRETGAPLTIHPGRHAEAPFEILAVLEPAGADLARTVMCHVDRTIGDHAALARLATSGCYLEYDLFGFESSHYPWEIPVDLPNDAMRLGFIRWLLDEGFGERVLLSHDVCLKRKLSRYGGHGYAHIPRNVVRLMRRKRFSEAEINRLLVDNPARLLAFADPA